MLDLLQKEFIYLWYYSSVLFNQIAIYWVFGIFMGSVISVFGKEKIHKLFVSIQNKRLGIFGVIPASMLGIASPLCMFGTIPIAASFSQKGMRDDWLAAFMMSSILLNPQLLIYSAALGKTVFSIRLVLAIICGILAGLCVRLFFRDKGFFNFSTLVLPESRDTDPNMLMRLIKNIWRNLKATGGYFLLGILLSAMFQRYVSPDAFASLFGNQQGFGVLLAATIGVPLYVCGGGTIPLLLEWLRHGMTLGAAAAFMVTGPATKITNLGAVKIVLGKRQFSMYLAYTIVFAITTGIIIDIAL
ncbi:permease [Methanolobus sediminis]|uniref:Permease n=1 Tax=Methanolobus sediminis TaxID=3072978 RepID=A0AA51UL88_9EURY|nr:permease [Methanolobus sediminis]WMW25641.1 permease [Methanolobus sediminis]